MVQRLILGVCRRRQKQAADTQYGCRKRLRQTRSGSAVFGRAHALSPFLRCTPETGADCLGSERMADRRFGVRRGRYPVTKMTHRRWMSRRQILAPCHPIASKCSIETCLPQRLTPSNLYVEVILYVEVPGGRHMGKCAEVANCGRSLETEGMTIQQLL